MIEEVKYKKKLLALVVSGKYRNKKGITFFTSDQATQQFGYMKHEKGHIINPHTHKKRLTKILSTTEVILLLKGVLRVDFYSQQTKYLFSKIVEKDNIIILHEGSHGFKILQNCSIIEIKQGPFIKLLDKTRFNKVDEKKIKIKK